jgi:hypothetical protein
MENIAVVPPQITTTFASLKPKNGDILDCCHGRPAKIHNDIKPSHYGTQSWYYPPDFLYPLYSQYTNHFGTSRTFLIPKMCAAIYRLTMKIPEITQLSSVLRNDNDFAQAVGFPLHTLGINSPSKPRHHANIGFFGMNQIYQELMYIEQETGTLTEVLHNLTDELNFKKISFDGIIPSVWVEYYRKPSTTISRDEFDAVFANNTGIDIIDDLTRNLPLDMRSDIRQDAALMCLEGGIDINSKSNEDTIANIVRSVIRKSKKEYWAKFYKERSLFAKIGDGDTELWQLLVPSN